MDDLYVSCSIIFNGGHRYIVHDNCYGVAYCLNCGINAMVSYYKNGGANALIYSSSKLSYNEYILKSVL